MSKCLDYEDSEIGTVAREPLLYKCEDFALTDIEAA